VECEKALILHQYSLISGKTTIKATKLAVRLEIPFRRVAVLLSAPDWNVLFLNEQSKIYCRCLATAWRSPMGSGAALFRPGDPSSLKAIGSESSTLQELACKKYTLKQPASVSEHGQHTWQRLMVSSGQLYIFDGNAYPRGVGIVLARTLGTVPLDGIPLSFTVVNNNGGHSEELKLEDHSQANVKASDFQIPKDFKLVATPEDVIHSDAVNEGLSEFLH
jgi:hypothetical protein